ncbi:hypothetical protein FQA47_023548 [Oryzias melastigma]|uniref:Uncharacterized protein n=1 Tax=Oryzias melastigma TaxID=30732 RepID=A0A834FP27_ORYME|nr:hypothetical protein FQA47_023548 [Oryzias melastigma]
MRPSCFKKRNSFVRLSVCALQTDGSVTGGVKERPERQLDVSVCQWELSERGAHQRCAHTSTAEEKKKKKEEKERALEPSWNQIRGGSFGKERRGVRGAAGGPAFGGGGRLGGAQTGARRCATGADGAKTPQFALCVAAP